MKVKMTTDATDEKERIDHFSKLVKVVLFRFILKLL
jgi:hypothetical protein